MTTGSPLRLLPVDLFRDRILPYTYRTQPTALQQDLFSYHRTIAHVKTIYGTRYPTTETTLEDESDMAWLSNDICRFLNNDQPTMLGYVEFYRAVFQRLYMNHKKEFPDVRLPPPIGDVHFNDIKVSIGLMLPLERQQLERFLSVGTI
jgi:hypothetical protein